MRFGYLRSGVCVRRKRGPVPALSLILLLVLGSLSSFGPVLVFACNPGISIEKYTNGLDADLPPGTYIRVGEVVEWTYNITNTGDVCLTNIVVVDDQIGNINLTKDSLAPGESMIAHAYGVALAGQYSNNVSVTGTPSVSGYPNATDSDLSHYFGSAPSIHLEKYTNGSDAEAAPGPYVFFQDNVTWTYNISNTGNVVLTDIVLIDNQTGTVSLPYTVLAAGEYMVVMVNGTAVVGQYSNLATVNGTGPTGYVVSDTDVSHYYGGGAIICGVAFVDKNGNGVRDAGESGILGVTITRDGITNKTTDSDGKYSFAVLQGVPGIHNVSAVVIQGMFRTTPGTVFLNLEPGWINTTDFGYAPLEGYLGVAYGTVFNDTNHNGVQEIGEKGIAGVNVSLYNSTGHLINYTFTSSLGSYTLRVNENGNYTIIETDPAKHVSTTPNIINATLVTGSSNDSPYDFGDFKGAVIMGTVFNDLNVNGTKDVGEPPVADATVSANGESFSTSGLLDYWGGNYRLYVNDGERIYDVIETDPPGYVSTNAIPRDPNVTRVDASKVKVNVTYGNYYRADFGDVQPSDVGKIWGVVFHDKDGDGLQDPGEPGIPGAVVSLSSGQYMTTDSSGSYLLYGPPETNVSVVEFDSPGWVSTTPNNVTANTKTVPNGSIVNFGDRLPIELEKYTNGVDAESAPGPYIYVGRSVKWTYSIRNLYVDNVNLTNIVLVDDQLGNITNLLPRNELGPGESMIVTATGTAVIGQYNNTATVNATAHGSVTFFNTSTAELIGVNIDGTSWNDSDVSYYYGVLAVVYGAVFNDSMLVNGLWDSGEDGIPDVNVTLWLGGKLVDSVLTNVSGRFYMPLTQLGVYTVSEINPSGYFSTNAIPDGGVKIDNDKVNFTVELDRSYEVIFGDAKISPATYIQGYVFDDENEDGLFNATTEHGIPNVNVTLEIVDPNYPTITYIINVTTSFNGFYQFAVPPGTLCRLNSAGPPDPAWYPTTPESIFARVPTAGIYPDNNFGYSNDSDVATIYGIVFQDMNGNGKQDFGEVGLGLVSANVSLYKDSELLLTTTTRVMPHARDGTFTFAINETGVCNVIEVNPSGWRSTTPDNVPVHVSELGQGYEVNFGDINRTDMSSFYGTVFEDSNTNGARDLAEPGIQNVTLDLYNSTGPIANYTTNRWGQYTFLIRQPEVYHVIETDLPAYVSTIAVPGDPNVTKISNSELKINVTAGMLGADFGDNLFGDAQASSVAFIHVFVFNDTDGDGSQDPYEPGIAGANIELSSGLAGKTNSTGQITLYGPSYTPVFVCETDLSGWISTTPNNVTIPDPQPGEENATFVYFGDNEGAFVSGFVYNDKDGDRSKDSGEPGISNVQVELHNQSWWTWKNSSSLVSFTKTSSNGEYSFTLVSPNDYVVTEKDPSGWTSTTDNQVNVTINNLDGQTIEVNFGDRYTTYRDDTDPVIDSVVNDPEPPLKDGESTKVSVKAHDNIGVVRVTIEWPGSGPHQMAYSSTSKLWEYTIPGQEIGTSFLVKVKAYDSAGNSDTASFSKWWGEPTEPVIVSVTNDPEPPLEHLEPTLVIVKATDDVGVENVTIEWPGSDVHDMVYDETSDVWKYTIPGQSAGTNFSLTVKAYDAAGNYAESTFSKWWSDQTDPIIVSVTQSNDAPSVGEDVTITAHITDNVGVDHVTIAHDNVDHSMTLESGNATDGYWVHTIPGPETETVIAYTVIAYDGAGNQATYGPHEKHWGLTTNISLWTAEGFADTTVYGKGFAPNSVITLTWNGWNITTAPLIIRTGDGGEFTAIINRVPLEMEPGINIVKAVDEMGNWSVASFNVLEAPQGEAGPAGVPGQDVPPGYIAGLFLVVLAISFLVSLTVTRSSKREEETPRPRSSRPKQP
ncbi:MAG: hypothetical protein OEZ48_01865 [Candidatus Bathyarchaeota archaeon]|nr:hypothetical protein [Candidatus Bathyarchaeota archaeon]